MKTKEEMKNEVVNYLESVSQHIYMTESGKYQTVVKKNEKYYAYKDGKLSEIDVDKYIEWYDTNAKNVISQILFPQHYDTSWGYSKETKLRAVRYNKYLRILVNEGQEAAEAFKTKQAAINEAKESEVVGN